MSGMLKFILLALLILVVIVLLLGWFAPRQVDISRDRIIEVPAEKVFAAVNDLTTWKHWSPWQQKDSSLKVTFGEKTSGLGASYSWTSKHSGNGRYTITQIEPNRSLVSSLEFDGQGEGEGYWKFEEVESGKTKTTWGLRFDLPYPFNAMLLFKNMDSAGADFDEGLDYLKAYLEEEAEKIGSHTVKKEAWTPKHYITIRKDGLAQKDIPDFLSKAYSQIGEYLGSHHITPSGAPAGLYYLWDEKNKTTDLAAAIPVRKKPENLPETLTGISLENDSALIIDYYGSYENSGSAHAAMDTYMNEHGFTLKPPVLEEYLTDPGAEADPSKWHTRIVYFWE